MPYRTKKELRTTAKAKPLTKKTEKHPDYNTRSFISYSLKSRQSNPKCNECNRLFYFDELCLDHVIPVSEGGAFWDKRNHQILCTPCHNRKTNKEVRNGCHTRWELNDDNEKIPLQNKAQQ